jgi:hypothetical protein
LVIRDLTEEVGQDRRITDVAPGDFDGPNLQRFLVDPEVDLAPDAPFRATMLAGVPFAFALDLDAGAVRCPAGHCAAMSREGISRCSGPFDPRYGMLTAKVFWRRDSVLKSGTVQSRPTSRSRLSTDPVVCRSAMPNKTFIERHVWIAASL